MLKVGRSGHGTLSYIYRDAWRLAEDIKRNSTDVKNVIVFGEIARDHVGNTFNLLLIVEQAQFQEFMETLDNGHTDPFDRRANAAKIVHFDEKYDMAFISNDDLDVWLFPGDWLNQIEAIKDRLPEGYKGLFHNIEREYRQPLPA